MTKPDPQMVEAFYKYFIDRIKETEDYKRADKASRSVMLFPILCAIVQTKNDGVIPKQFAITLK